MWHFSLSLFPRNTDIFIYLAQIVPFEDANLNSNSTAAPEELDNVIRFLATGISHGRLTLYRVPSRVVFPNEMHSFDSIALNILVMCLKFPPETDRVPCPQSLEIVLFPTRT